MHGVFRFSQRGLLTILSSWFGVFAQAQGPFSPLSPYYDTSPEWMSPPRRQITSAAYGNGIFVGVGDRMTILVSKDGKKWINRSSQITDRIANINFTTETYGEGGDVLTFATSERWPSENELLGRPFRLRAVGFGNGKFVAVGDCGVVVSSNDGDDWITLNNVTTVQLNGIAWAVSNFVVVGEQGTILTSPDGNFWIRRKSGTKESLSGVAYGNGVFVAVGDNSTILTSADGIEWVPQSIQLLAPIGHIAFGN